MKSLITITTCRRLNELKKNIIPFIQFCKNNEDFDFLVSLDGTEEDYISFCETNNIPLIYSDEQEGVGLSRNRVCSMFNKYDSFFFIDDDVEIINTKIFSETINLSKTTGYSHFSPVHTIGVLKQEKIGNQKIIHSNFGGGYFLFYTKECIDNIGGWHTLFAKYKRYGHTEHSYRAYKKKINPISLYF